MPLRFGSRRAAWDTTNGSPPNMLWFSARWYGDLNRVQEDAYNASVAADGAGGGGGFSAGGGSGAGSTGSGAD